MNVFSLMGTIALKGGPEVTKQLGDIDKKGEKTGSTLGKIAGGIAKAGLAIGAAAGAGLAALGGVAMKAAEATDRVDKMSQKIGISRQAFQEWDFVLSQNGMNVEQLQMGFKTLVAKMEEASTGAGKGAELFARLGVSATDSAGKLRTQEEVFKDTVRALQAMPDGAEKARMANELFGRSGSEMMPLLNGAAGSVDELTKKAHEMGLIMSNEAIDAGVKFTDTLDGLKRSLGTVFSKIGVEVMPIMQQLADWVIANMPTIQAVFNTVFTVIGDLIKEVGEIFKTYIIPALQDLWSWIEPHLPAIKSFFENTFNAIKYVIKEVVIPIIKEFVRVVKEWVENNKEKLTEIWNKFKDVFEKITEVIKLFVKWAKDFWDEWGETIKRLTKNTFDIIAETIDNALQIIGGIFDLFIGIFTGDWERAWEGIKNIFGGVFDQIKGMLKTALNNILAFFNTDLSALWTSVTGWFGKIYDGIAEKMNSIKTWINDTLNTIKEKFSSIGTSIKNVFVQAFEGMGTGIKSAINKIIEHINGLIRSFANGINNIANLANKVPGVNLPKVNVPQIPKLATGTNYVPKDMLAQLHEGEAVVPKRYNPAAGGKGQGSGNIVFERGAFEGMTLMNERDADKFGEMLVKKLKNLGVATT